MTNIASTTTSDVRSCCQHCGIASQNPSGFCCAGCEAIFLTMHELGLTKFYHYRDGHQTARSVASPQGSDYTFLDSLVPLDASTHTVVLEIEGIHCAGCLWLLERLPQILAGVLESRLNFSAAQLQVTIDTSKCTLSAVARRLDSLGYPVHAAGASSSPGSYTKDERRMLMRIGVASFCAMNTMMLAVSLWQGWSTGIEAQFGGLLRWVSLGLTIPAVTFSAWPFLVTAYHAVRSRTLHIDIPIALSLIGGFTVSTFNTVVGRDYVYFDSVTALIALLLTGRFLQSRALRQARDTARSAWKLLPQIAHQLIAGDIVDTAISKIGVNTLVVCHPGERVPIDGTIETGSSLLDAALLTGESIPRVGDIGDSIHAGELVIDGSLTIRSTVQGGASRVDRILEKIDTEGEKAPLLSITDQASGYFVAVILLVSCSAGIWWYWTTDIFTALDVFVATLIVTCPCALGIATPAALIVAVGKAAKCGQLIRGAGTIERLAICRTICLDKTGTLTSGNLEVAEIFVPNSEDPTHSALVFGLIGSLAAVTPHHPVARSLLGSSSAAGPICADTLTEIKYLPGRGVQARDRDGRRWQLGSLSWAKTSGAMLTEEQTNFCTNWFSLGATVVSLSCDNKVSALVTLRDTLLAGAKSTIAALQDMGLRTVIVSGDASTVVKSVAAQLNISPSDAHGDLSPEQKVSVLGNYTNGTIMVGDGFNDAYAMKVANVGIGVRGAIDSLVEAVDIYVSRRGIVAVPELILGAHRTMRVIYRNLFVSGFYNIVGASLAVSGLITPLWAAVLMPLSSLSVILLSLHSTTFTQRDEAKF